MEIITVSDLASYLDDKALTTSPAAALKVRLANGLVSDALGTTTSPPSRVTAITLEVAARSVRNPEGYSSETIDDYTYRRDAETRQAGVYLTSDERDELLLIAGRRVRSAHTVRMTSPLDLP